MAFANKACEKKYRVIFHRDNDVNVWIATSDDVPGLVLESDSLDDLMKRIPLAIPDLLDSETEVSMEENCFEQVYM